MKRNLKKISALISFTILFSSCDTSSPAFAEKELPFIALTRKTTALPPQTITAVKTLETAPQTTESAETAEPASPLPDYEKFSERLSEIYSENGVYGMSVALFKDGKIIHTENLGFADVENQIPADNNTKYRCASVSKPVSTVVLMTLYDDGKITPDSSLYELTGIEYDDVTKNSVKLWHLLTHTAGITDTYTYEYIAVMRQNDINDIMKYARNGCKAGTVYNYTNFGAGTMGAVVERITDEYFYDYAERALFKPMNMDAGYLIDYIEDKESCAKLYDFDGEIFDVKSWKRNAEFYESFGLGNSYYVAQCELIISASDLARIGIILAGGAESETEILSCEAVEKINTCYFSAENFDMGLNVRIYDDLVDGRVIYGHPGNALGCITGLFYDPADNTGIAILTNHCIPNKDEDGFYLMLKNTIREAYADFFDK